MPKKKEKNGEEFYRGKLREAEKQIRELQRQVREKERTGHIKKRDVEFREKTNPCPHCGKGEIKIVDIAGLLFENCSICHHRRRIKNGDKP